MNFKKEIVCICDETEIIKFIFEDKKVISIVIIFKLKQLTIEMMRLINAHIHKIIKETDTSTYNTGMYLDIRNIKFASLEVIREQALFTKKMQEEQNSFHRLGFLMNNIVKHLLDAVFKISPIKKCETKNFINPIECWKYITFSE